MEDILIECSPGISGDMLLGAFYDLGVPKKVIEQPLIDLGLNDRYSLDFQESKSCSIRGVKAKVENIECDSLKRDWRSIKELILNGDLEDKLQQIIYKVFIIIILMFIFSFVKYFEISYISYNFFIKILFNLFFCAFN